MATQTNKTVMAIVEEVTEGTPVVPTAGTQYIALQEGFSLEPGFETLENAELTGSIGTAKPIVGKETPTASISHYIKHSGVEGTAPNYGLLLEAALGDTSTAGAEYNTVAASTTTVIKVDAGEGATFERGEALLIKDGTNGYEIRNIESISTDDLTLSVELGTAPGVGVDLGQAVLYKPGEAHPTFSVWNFRGNGAAVELVAGSRVTECTIEGAAGQLINGSFSMSGIEYFFNPITITSSNNKIDFANDAIPTELTATIASDTYKDPYDFAAAVETAMDAVSGDDITVSYDDLTGKFTIESAGGTFQLLWNTGTNVANSAANELGYSTAADDTGATTYLADNAQGLTRLHTPSFDSSNPLVAKANEVHIGSNICVNASTVSVSIANEKVDIESVCATSGVSGSVIGGRTVTVNVSAVYETYDVGPFYGLRTGTTLPFAWNFGTKAGGNWVAGTCGNVYIPTATISSFSLTDQNGLVSFDLEMTAYVSSGLGECYINFL